MRTFIVATAAGIMVLGAAATTTQIAVASPSDAAAVALLSRAAAGTRTTAYDGVQQVTRWTGTGPASLLVHVTHVPGVGVMAQVTQTADQPARGAVLDAGEQDAAGLSMAADQLALLQAHYVLSVEPSSVVNGRPVDVVGVSRHDGTLAAMFWVDHATGLVLRRELLDTQGRLELVSDFLDVTVLRTAPQLPTGSAQTVRPQSSRLVPASKIGELRKTGFRAPIALAGGYQLVDARVSGSGARQTVHLTYCDGLTTLSLFEQAGRLARTRSGASAQTGGLPAQLTWAGSGLVFTLLGDGADDALAAAAAGLPHGQRHRSLLGRIGQGFHRIASWLNPFG